MIISETRQVILRIYGGEISRKKPVTERVLDQLSEFGRPSALRLLSFSLIPTSVNLGSSCAHFLFLGIGFLGYLHFLQMFSSFPPSFFLNKISLCSLWVGGQGICPMSQGLDWQCEGPVLAASLEGLMCPDLGKVTNFNILQQKL